MTPQPARCAILAAESLLTMPPTEVSCLVPWAIASISSVMVSTTGTTSPVPCMSISPGILDRIKSMSACTTLATSAERVSLSPNLISVALTVSFSLTMGTAPFASRHPMVLQTALCRWRVRRSSRVSRTWATVKPCRSKHCCQLLIKILWPTAAQACRAAKSFGRFSSLSFPMPRPTAPELTRITSMPSWRSALT